MDGDGIKLAILSFAHLNWRPRLSIIWDWFGSPLTSQLQKLHCCRSKQFGPIGCPLPPAFILSNHPHPPSIDSEFPISFEFHQKMASKMNSSHSTGRPSTVQKRAQLLVHHPPPQNSFVFGSSTPRELSHITHPKVTKRERLIDTQLKPKRNAGDRDIVYYMRQARSRDSRDPERKGISRNYAFGSSTPRSLSHMSNLTKAQRVYDAKMERKLDHWADERNAAQNMAGANRSLSTRDSRREEDALSEPDLVQDRQKDFDLGKPGMGKTNNEWTKSQMAEQNGGEEEGEEGERTGELEVEAALNHRAMSREIGEDDGKVKLNIRVPNLEAERGDMVQIEGEEEDRGEGGIGIRKIAAGGGHISPVSDF